jgi:PPOX class probable F420-dependent enzyme
VIPVCFVYDGHTISIAIDEKPKRVPPERLRRIRNIRANPRVALVVDEYREDWRRLWYVLVLGRASILGPEAADHAAVIARLRRKFPQYRTMRLEDRPILRIRPRRLIRWAARVRPRGPRR